MIRPVFSAWGIELEYMIVDRESLSVRPIADELFRTADGARPNEVDRGHYAWSNEFVLHLIELKNVQPNTALPPLVTGFQEEVHAINRLLEPMGACLMPTAMHPWMDPRSNTRLWPHEHAEIYQTYDRIFDCKRHGWANLQSMHLNLPYSSDEEFVRLHNTARLVLPILPALAASSPIAEQRFSGFMDFRMENYRGHQIKVPETIGVVIPDEADSIASYRNGVLETMYRAIAPFDPKGVLQHEWLNARGIIPRFDRSALEIRVIDIQECPQADLAIAAASIAVIKELYDSAEGAPPFATNELAEILQHCIHNAEQADIDHPAYLERFGFPGKRCTGGELWKFLVETHLQPLPEYRQYWQKPLKIIFEQGTLASRILKAAGNDYRQEHLANIYRQLCDCLDSGRMFEV